MLLEQNDMRVINRILCCFVYVTKRYVSNQSHIAFRSIITHISCYWFRAMVFLGKKISVGKFDGNFFSVS